MNPYGHMMELLGRYHAAGADGERLANEMMVSGYNVVRDFVRMEVGEPWVWTNAMAEFYRASDAFIYELLVWHHRPERIQARAEMARHIRELFPDGAKILFFGDGIGYDCATVALRNPGAVATSFEFEGFSSAFAARMIEDLGLGRRVEAVHRPERLTKESYDAVACFDVLEHVPDPPKMIAEIGSHLRPGGHAFISEAFDVVNPLRPTHLASNLRFAGRTIALFERRGLTYTGQVARRILHFEKRSASRMPGRKAGLKLKRRVAGLLSEFRFKRLYADGDVDLAGAISGERVAADRTCSP